MLTPNEFQAPVINDIVQTARDGAILAWGVGVGKSLAGVEVARLRRSERVLITAPTATLDGWYATVFWQTRQRLRPVGNKAFSFRAALDHNDRKNRTLVKVTKAEAQANLAALEAGEPGWYWSSREFFTLQQWKKIPAPNGVIDPKTGKVRMVMRRTDAWTKKAPVNVLISDEHQRFAARGNRGQQAFEHARAGLKLIMSQDWFGSQLENMWTVSKDAYGMDRGVEGMKQDEWCREYFTTTYNPHNYRKFDVVAEKWPGYFTSTLPNYYALPPSVEPPEIERWPVTLGPAERKAYDKLEKDMVTEVPDGLLVAEVPLTLRIRLREMSLAMPTPVSYEVVNKETGEIETKWTIEYRPGAASSKLDAIKEILGDHAPHKFVIFTHSAKWAHWAANELGDMAEAWTGKVSTKERDEIKERFVSGNLRVIIGIPEAMGVGTDGLQHVCSRVIFASRSDQNLMNGQGLGRIARQGQEESVQCWSLEAEDTYDREILSRQLEDALALSVAKGQEKREAK